MNIIFRIYTLIIVLSLLSCQSSSEADAKIAQARQLFDEAIAVHDEVMPRMDEIMKLKMALNARIDSLEQQEQAVDSVVLHDLQLAASHLEQADEGMMQWMRNMQKAPAPNEMPEDVSVLVQVQHKQKLAIEKVKVQMESSIQEAKGLLE